MTSGGIEGKEDERSQLEACPPIMETTAEGFLRDPRETEDQGIHFVHVWYPSVLDWQSVLSHGATWREDLLPSVDLPKPASAHISFPKETGQHRPTASTSGNFNFTEGFQDGVSTLCGVGGVPVGPYTHTFGTGGYEFGLAPHIHVGNKGPREPLGWLWLLVLAEVLLVIAIIAKVRAVLLLL